MKSRLRNNTGNNGTVNVEIPVLLKYLSKDYLDYWRSVEMPLINCEIIIEVIWSANFAIYVTEREKIWND